MWLECVPVSGEQVTLITPQTGSKSEKGPEHTSSCPPLGCLAGTERPKECPQISTVQSRMSRKDPRNREGLSKQTWINGRAINGICPVSPEQPKHQQSDFAFQAYNLAQAKVSGRQQATESLSDKITLHCPYSSHRKQALPLSPVRAFWSWQVQGPAEGLWP